MWKKLLALIGVLGPGLFLVGYNIGTGSITTMAVTGAEYGMVLMWPLLLSCVFTFVLIVAFGRYTAVTGETALHSFKTHFGKGAALFVLVSLLFSEFVSSMGVMAIVVQTVQEWSRPLTASGDGFNPILLALLFGTLIYLIFLNGTYRFFEKILALFVGLMGLSLVSTMLMVIPDPAAVLEGLIPRIPSEGNAALLIAGMVGTTMGGVLFVVRSILVKEKGWTVKDLKIERRDAFVSVLLMFLLSIAVMAAAAGTLYPRGLHVENAIDMVRLLEPLAGRFAIINVWRPIAGPVLSTPLAVCDAQSVAPADLVPTERRAKDRIGEVQQVLFNPAHRWFYFPTMQRDEALLIKTYDSATDGRARYTIHTAFDDPNTPEHARARESVEVRTLAFF